MNENSFNTKPWNQAEKIFFRLICAYFVIYLFPFPINYVSFIWDYISEPYNALWDVMVHWAAKNVFSMEGEIQQMNSGSGDTTYHYLTWFVNILIAVPVTLIWSVVDWKRANYERLYFYLEIILRYSLAFALINYGLIKIIKTQFPSPGPWQLMQAIGDLSPMGLAWLFMGYSSGFNLFTGLGEALGGVFILYRRTRLLGLLLAITVMTNVVVMNFCYDIPVKLYSMHLLGMAILLLLRDGRRIVDFLILNRAVAKKEYVVPAFFKKYKIPILLIKLAFIGFVVYPLITNVLENQKKWGDKKPKPSLYGIYEVQEFTKNNIPIPPLLTDSIRWKNMVVQWDGHVNIQLINEKTEGWAFEVDTLTQRIKMHSYRDSANINGYFVYEKPNAEELWLEGVWKKDSLKIKMDYKSVEDFKLIKRKFHWINERPYH